MDTSVNTVCRFGECLKSLQVSGDPAYAKQLANWLDAGGLDHLKTESVHFLKNLSPRGISQSRDTFNTRNLLYMFTPQGGFIGNFSQANVRALLKIKQGQLRLPDDSSTSRSLKSMWEEQGY